MTNDADKKWPDLVVVRDGAAGFSSSVIFSLVAGKILQFVKVTQVLVRDEKSGEEFEVRADALGVRKMPSQTQHSKD